MSEDHGPGHDEHKREHRTEHQTAQPGAGLEGLQAPGFAPSPSYSNSLLGDSRLNGRGNGPVRTALMLGMQQTYGNRVTQRFLQRIANSKSSSLEATEGKNDKGIESTGEDQNGIEASAEEMAGLDSGEHIYDQVQPEAQGTLEAQGAPAVQRESDTTPRLFIQPVRGRGGRRGGRGGRGNAQVRNTNRNPLAVRPQIVKQRRGGRGGRGRGPQITTRPPAPTVSVNRIEIVDSPAGAVTGFPAITSGDLNTPGPYNDAATGGVNNVHQIHFYLDHGTSNMLTPRREIQRSAWIAGTEHKNPSDQGRRLGGFNGSRVGADGPGAHEISRPNRNRLVVADGPGISALNARSYPFIYRAHFVVTVADASGRDIARIRYDVRIEKRSAADVPNTHNSITATEKIDLVRNRNL